MRFTPTYLIEGIVLHQKIIDFHLDEENDWVADLACGHTQHVRHEPPMQSRPWVETEAGRQKFIGYELNCKMCDEESAVLIPEQSGS